MELTAHHASFITGSYECLKSAGIGGVPAQRLPEVVGTVSEMLSVIEKGGRDAVTEYSRKLDGWAGGDVELDADSLRRTGDSLKPELRAALEAGAERTTKFAGLQLQHLQDFQAEVMPGVVVGHRYIPVQRVGAYLPAGRFPILASAFMTVGVAKTAGVPTVIACSPPTSPTAGNPAVFYSAYLSGVDRAFVVGGVQALAAMAFGLLGEQPMDMLVGAGNAYVTEAKRQLFGRVGMDLLAGPSEVAVIADDTADPVIVAADLLGQAEHGPQSPAALVTTSLDLAVAVIAEVDRQLADLSTRDIAGPAWRDYGTVYVAEDNATAVELMDVLAPEHLEVITADDDYFQQNLTNYGSLFLGPWSTVAYSDKGITGTNHVLPTGGGARSSAGLSVSRFLKPLTFQRIDRSATMQLAPLVSEISSYEQMEAHQRTADLRITRFETQTASTKEQP